MIKMSDEWDILTWKEKKAVRLSIKRNKGRISKKFIDDIYSDKNKPKNLIRKLKKHGFLEDYYGNRYTIKEHKIPNEELIKIKKEMKKEKQGETTND